MRRKKKVGWMERRQRVKMGGRAGERQKEKQINYRWGNAHILHESIWKPRSPNRQHNGASITLNAVVGSI